MENIFTHSIKEVDEVKPLTRYQRNKEQIKKWQTANKEKYLLNQHLHYLKTQEDPEKKARKLQQVKDRYNKLKEQKKQEGLLKPVGRPSKYQINNL